MYIPDINKWEDKEQIIEFMNRYSFAQMITVIDGKPHATPLPFLISSGDDNQLILLSHLARFNEQADHIDGKEHLVIFQEPHGFIPEKLYDRPSVPTWDYLAVHVYGVGELIDDPQDVLSQLKRTADHYEPDFWSRWPELNETYKRNLLNELSCFRLKVTDLQAKSKISQNHTSKTQSTIKAHLASSSDPSEQTLSQYFP